ncbi:LPS assembly lipoprotein LptE [uncultured Azonexus sp.]|uniref:LPS-assembly lipoprotein LptE n=1 Tax=uncultured Azonexus sp. TaxID=520307 RepID=UPI0026153E28|nr:LPS assembly lipoprotein LptE [uncultured Azonexus sp.]
MRYPLRSLFALLLALLVAGCGFHLRGAGGSDLPYRTMYIALPETAEVRIWLERYIRSSGDTEIVGDAKQAAAVFQQLGDNRQKTILSVNAQGRVREYRLQLDYTFRLVDGQGRELVAPNKIALTRDISFDDSSVLTKDIEEGILWRDMNNDLVNQIMRRLSLIKPKDPTATEED